MLKAERVSYIQKTLENLYPETPIPLDHTNAYTLLIAVLLSAQCTDERVNLVTPELFQLADNPYAMMKVGVESIREVIRPCGRAATFPRRGGSGCSSPSSPSWPPGC